MILFINACVREQSRTKHLADYLLTKLDGAVEEVRLTDIEFPVVNNSFLEKRNHLIEDEAFNDPMFALARQFARAEQIVIAAPYWDLSFPASLKQYFEQINVLGITFIYTPEGFPKALCNAKKLYYVTTAGGSLIPEEYGFGYVKSLASNFYGIPEILQFQATGLDITGADVEDILRRARESISQIMDATV